MMRYLLMAAVMISVAGCGGGDRYVGGDIATACVNADRRAASPALCSCVQQVANQSLSAGDQARAATFFANPDLAQITRRSDNPSDERFWLRYRAFADLAEQICVPVA